MEILLVVISITRGNSDIRGKDLSFTIGIVGHAEVVITGDVIAIVKKRATSTMHRSKTNKVAVSVIVLFHDGVGQMIV